MLAPLLLAALTVASHASASGSAADLEKASAGRILETLRERSRESAFEAPAALASQEDGERVYSKLYEAGRAPELAELAGDWRGSAIALPRGRLREASELLERVLETLSLRFWEGKRFDETGGANRFLGDRLRLFRFSAQVAPSRTGQGEALALDYSGNPYPISAVRDEVRLIEGGRLLGRAYMRAPDGKEHFLFFFALEKE